MQLLSWAWDGSAGLGFHHLPRGQWGVGAAGSSLPHASLTPAHWGLVGAELILLCDKTRAPQSKWPLPKGGHPILEAGSCEPRVGGEYDGAHSKSSGHICDWCPHLASLPPGVPMHVIYCDPGASPSLAHALGLPRAPGRTLVGAGKRSHPNPRAGRCPAWPGPQLHRNQDLAGERGLHCSSFTSLPSPSAPKSSQSSQCPVVG